MSVKQDPRIRHAPDRAETYGDLAAGLASSYQLTPDPWQQIVLDDWLGVDAEGKWSSLTCGLSIARQNGKNAIIEVRELFGMVGRGEKILHTAHEVKTARKAFKRLQHFFGTCKDDPGAKFPELNKLVAEVRNVNGQEAIILTNGGSVEVVARSKNSGRGFTVDVLILDEAQEMSDDDLEALLPTTSSAPLGNPQWIFTGTPPGPRADGAVFGRTRREAVETKAPRLCWHEWSPAEDDDPANRAVWKATNPALLTGRLQMSVVEGEFGRFSEDGFARERLGRWDADGATTIFGADRWGACLEAESEGVKLEALAVATSHDLAFTAIVGAGHDGERVQVKPLQHAPGQSWALQRIIELSKKSDCPVVIDDRSAASPLIAALERAGVKVVQARTADVLDAAASTYNAVAEKTIKHAGYAELDDAIRVAKKRPVSKRWAFGPRKDGDDISPLEAMSLVVWQLTKVTKQRESAYADDHDLVVI